jgi:hypothetical protein
VAREKKAQVYHCDGYYWDNVCPSRGDVDPADIRYRKDKDDKTGYGVMRRRHLCKSFGLSPLNDDQACPHCPENRGYFQRPKTQRNSRVVSLTPFQACNSNMEVVRAFKRKAELTKFLNKQEGLVVKIA